jgi:hypothetical protein
MRSLALVSTELAHCLYDTAVNFNSLLQTADIAQEFQQFMANAARDMLEERFKAKGSAKFIEGEFLLQDENEHMLSLRSPWKSIMKPGQRRYLSIKFRAIATTAYPHCGTDNELFEGQNTIW